MPGRSFTNTGALAYRYGFNGKENDNDVKGEGNQQDYGMRIYDPRIGKFLSVDPITANYPELTPYQFASNRPIDGIDRDGLEFERSIGGSAPDYSLFNLFLPKEKRLSLVQTEVMRKSHQKGLALGSAIGLTSAFSVMYAPVVSQWLITPQGSMQATRLLWGAFANEDMPGGFDDITRGTRLWFGRSSVEPRFIFNTNRLKFFFGKGTGTSENIAKSLQRAEDFGKLGINDTEKGVTKLIGLMDEAVNATASTGKTNAITGRYEVFKTVDVIEKGKKKGSVTFGMSYSDESMKGTPEIMTAIPMPSKKNK